jgi:L-lactate dehydrogenase complex protein LldG
MTSRDQILADLRACPVDPAELPDQEVDGIRFADPVAQFLATLEGVGGTAVQVDGGESLTVELERWPAWKTGSRRCSLMPEVQGNVDLSLVQRPQDLADLDCVVARGEFAVAENGAVWVDDRAMAHRAALFLTQHLVLVVPTAGIVDNMHQAYDRFDPEPAGFGVFISGPSKTADIEQALVIGAHGPRSLRVLLVGPGLEL